MAYPPSFTYPSQQHQYHQSLQNHYQSDHPQQNTDSFPQQDIFPQQNVYQQDLYPQSQQDPYSQLPRQQPFSQQAQQPPVQYSQESPQTQRNQLNFYSQPTTQPSPLRQVQQNQYLQQAPQNQLDQSNGFPQAQHTQQSRSSQSPPRPTQQAQLNSQTQQVQQNQFGQPGHHIQRPPFPQLSGLAQRLQSSSQYSQQQPSQQQPPANVAGTYQLFFTGRDDPRSCMLIGEDTKPVYLSFETQESNLNQTLRTMVYKNEKDLCAKLEWGTGTYLGDVTVGSRRLPMSHLVLPGSIDSARRFTSVDGKQFEWRCIRDDATAYDLFMAPNVRIALFRKYNQLTAIGPSHGLIQYTFSNDNLLIEALLALLLNRWIDTNGIQFSG